jgi:Spy/CpxP family protein refolding chaperone
VRAFIFVGIFGGFTTFSAFSLETLGLFHQEAWGGGYCEHCAYQCRVLDRRGAGFLCGALAHALMCVRWNSDQKGGGMKMTGVFNLCIASFLAAALIGQAGDVLAAKGSGVVTVVEKKASLESVKSDLEDKLGLTREQYNKIKAIRDEFRARQMAIKNALNAKHEALRQELDGDAPARAKVEPVVVEIKALQGQLVDNRVDVVFKLREIYSPRQIKIIKDQAKQQRKTISVKRPSKKKKNAPLKKK